MAPYRNTLRATGYMKEPVWWVLHQTVLPLHNSLLAEFGGAFATPDEPLLESAPARPRNLCLYEQTPLISLATEYTNGIVKKHPVVDGNERTGHVVGGLFLERNGHGLNASEEEAIAAFRGVANNTITEKIFAHWLQDNCE